MDERTELYGWLAAGNLNIEWPGVVLQTGECSWYSRLLNKFPQDAVWVSDDEWTCFMDGDVYNKDAFMAASAEGEWQHAFASSLRRAFLRDGTGAGRSV